MATKDDLDENPFNLPREVVLAAKAMRARFDAILRAPPAPDDSLPDLTPKQLDRIAAINFDLTAPVNRTASPMD